jgi:hypothetical protein
VGTPFPTLSGLWSVHYLQGAEIVAHCLVCVGNVPVGRQARHVERAIGQDPQSGQRALHRAVNARPLGKFSSAAK